MKQLKPILGRELELAGGKDAGWMLAYKENEERITGMVLKGSEAEAEDFSGLVVSGVRFENCRFWNCVFEKAEFQDVIFESCDFSGCDFADSYFNRTEFVSCKGVGAKLTGSRILHTTLRDSNWNYANYDNSVFEYFSVEDTELNGSNFSQCRCKSVVWKRANLQNASFFRTPMRGMDFTDSKISGLVLSDELKELNGATVDMFQAAELAKRLGLVIKS